MKFLTNLDLQKNELQNASIQNLATAPANPVQGQVYYDTVADAIKVYDGAAWQTLATGGGTVTSVSASTPLASTGGNTPTISIQDGTTTQKGAVQLENSYSSTSTTTAAVPAAVKAAYDLAASKASTSNKLSDFAATSSAELAGVISDETGTGALVFANTPTLVTPNIGAATGTSLVLSGDLTVNGTTTTINSTTITVDDKNIELGSVASPTDAGADGGGITLKGTTDKTLNWVDATDSWTSSENVDVATGKTYKVAGTTVLSGSALGTGVTGSSLTSVGTIGTGTWQGTAVGVLYGGTGSTTASGARSNLGLVIGTDVQAYNATLSAVANGVYTGDNDIATVGTITSGTWQGSAVGVLYGGTGSTTASGARTNLGLAIGTDVQAYNATLSAVANGVYTGDNDIVTVGTIGTGTWQGTAVGVLYGGTGSTTASGARTALGLAIGSDIQAYSATLSAVANGVYSGDDSITTVGTISAGTWQGTAIASTYGGALRYNTSAIWTAGEAKAITHSLGTKSVVVAVYDSSDNEVIGDVVTTSTSVVTITLSVAGTYRVVIIG